MAGSNNFLQWNANKTNQETDTQYNADALRVGGAVLNAIFPSALANKAFYQWSTFVAAFAQMMADKSYNLSDADFNALKAVLANVLTTEDLLINPAISPILYSNFQSSSVSGTTTETTLFSYTTAAGLVTTNRGIRVTFGGDVTRQNSSTPSKVRIWAGSAKLLESSIINTVNSFIGKGEALRDPGAPSDIKRSSSFFKGTSFGATGIFYPEIWDHASSEEFRWDLAQSFELRVQLGNSTDIITGNWFKVELI